MRGIENRTFLDIICKYSYLFFYNLKLKILNKNILIKCNFFNNNIKCFVETLKNNILLKDNIINNKLLLKKNVLNNKILLNIEIFKYIKIGDYLKVDKDTLWVTPEIWEKLEIMSNTNWIIN